MSRFLRKLILILFSSVFILSCQCSSKSKTIQKNSVKTQNDKFNVQKDFLKKERASIAAYQKDRDLKLTRTGTGLYYQITKDSISPVIEVGDLVFFDYKMFLMNGRLLYSSEGKSPRNLIVDKEDAEIGLHESLKLMTVGDEGLFILPSHLAFGVAGDQKKIPPKSALVYELKIIEVQKIKN